MHRPKDIKLVDLHGDILGFAPPLVTTKAEVDEIIAITESAVRSVMDELVRSGEKI